MTISYRASAATLIDATEDVAWDGNPLWLNNVFSAKVGRDRTALVGSGLYAIFLKQRLIYIGIFAGPEHNLFGGSILHSRWVRHAGILSMRGKQVSIRQNTRQVLRRIGVGTPLSELSTAAISGNAALLENQGMEMSTRKMEFAASHWDLFSGPMRETLEQIEFGYVRLDPKRRRDLLTKDAMFCLLKPVEKALVTFYQPPLNTQYNPTPHAAFAHADAVMDEIKRQLDGALSSLVPHVSSAAEAAPTSKAENDERDEELGEPFYNELPGAAKTFFEAFATAIIGAGRLFLYYTHDGKQARVAATHDGVRRHPFLVLEWRQNGKYSNTFKARSRLSIEEVKRFGFAATAGTDSQMRCEFPIVLTNSTLENLLALCEQVHKQDL